MTGAPAAPCPPGYVGLVDVDGLRHVIRVSSIQMLSDSDQCRDMTVAVVAGRSIPLPTPLDEVLDLLGRENWRPGRR